MAIVLRLSRKKYQKLTWIGFDFHLDEILGLLSNERYITKL